MDYNGYNVMIYVYILVLNVMMRIGRVLSRFLKTEIIILVIRIMGLY